MKQKMKDSEAWQVEYIRAENEKIKLEHMMIQNLQELSKMTQQELLEEMMRLTQRTHLCEALLKHRAKKN